jgi:hypothetical protein
MARQRRPIVILQRRLERSVALAQPKNVGQLRLSFVEMMAMETSEYAVLISSLGSELLSVGQLYRFIATMPTAGTSSTS